MADCITKDAVFIIDGSSFLYRAYYSIRPLTAPNGKPVQAVYGFCRMIKKLIDTYNPSCMVLVWDSKGKTVRHEMYQEYKSSRQATPSDLIEQKELILKFADLIKLPQLAQIGIEADDLMFSLAKDIATQGGSSILVTSDKDLGQALSEHTVILDPFKDAIVTQAILEEKLGFPLSKLPFYYALVGDSSDNIPGVKGIGPKNAKSLVTQFESLEDLYNNLDKISSERIRELCKASKEDAFLSEKLFILHKYDLPLTKSSCAFNAENWAGAAPLFQELNFKSLLKTDTIEKKKHPTLAELNRYQFIMVTQQEELEELCKQIQEHKKCALDTEGTSLRPVEGTMVGISLCVNEGKAYYIPFGHQTGEKQLDRETVVRILKPVLEDPTIKKFLHHAKFDALMLGTEGIYLQGVVFDTMIAASLVVEDGQRIGLKSLSDSYLQESMLVFNEVLKAHNCKDFSFVPLAPATEYAAADAHQTMRLYNLFEKELEKKQLSQFFHGIEMPMLTVLWEMEKEGIAVDCELLKNISQTIELELVSLRTEIINIIGIEFSCINLNSPKQLEELLFTHLKLPVMKKTAQKTGYSTDQEVLRDLAKLHPAPAFIMRYRELYKLKSTYLDALPDYVNPKTKRIHTTFSQTGVSTGRLASSDPNLQNIPVDKFHIRSAFTAPQGQLFLSVDYSQIELRVLAYLSQDTTLITAFKENKDIHKLTASGLFGISLEEVTHEQRQLGKKINFSILYGLTAHGLSKDLGISHKVAKEYIDKFMSQYSGVSNWMAQTIEQTKEKGYVTTLWGRRRYLPGIYEKNKTLYDLACRLAINTKAQGTAAELMKLSMVKLFNVIGQKKLCSKMVLQIHDELILHVPVQELAELEALAKSTMEHIVSWNVPLVVTTRVGKNWQEVTK